MDFTFSPEQQGVFETARGLLEAKATPERVAVIEKSSRVFDQELWSELCKTGLVSLTTSEEFTGAGLSMVEAATLLVEQGRRVAQVPLLGHLVGSWLLTRLCTASTGQHYLPSLASGELICCVGLSGLNSTRELDGHLVSGDLLADGSLILTGTLPCVRSLTLAQVLVVAFKINGTLGEGLAVVDLNAQGVNISKIETTDLQEWGCLVLGQVRVDPNNVLALSVGSTCEAVETAYNAYLVGLCALQFGVCDQAVIEAAAYTSQRHQFGKPLASFQGVALRAADCFIDAQAIGTTMWQSAWKLSEGLDCTKEVAVAKWWAAEAGHRVVHGVQHLHGGMGADVTYPIHRYFLWGKQLELEMGSGPVCLISLGRALAAS